MFMAEIELALLRDIIMSFSNVILVYSIGQSDWWHIMNWKSGHVVTMDFILVRDRQRSRPEAISIFV